MPWLDPSLSLRWGSYTKLDGDEQGQIVDATIKSKQAGLITKRMAVEKIADVYDIDNVDAVMVALEKEEKEEQKKEEERMKKQQEMQPAASSNPKSSAAPAPQPKADANG